MPQGNPGETHRQEEKGNRKDRLRGIAREYGAVLEQCDSGPPCAAWRRVNALGAGAKMAGISLVELSAMHHRVLTAALKRNPQARAAILKSGRAILPQLLSPFQEALGQCCGADRVLAGTYRRTEAEARRVAYVLNDQVGQLLAAAQIRLEDAAGDNSVPAPERMREVLGILNRIEDQVRCISCELYPTILDDLGLVAALEFLAGKYSRRCEFRVAAEGMADTRLPAEVESTLYWIGQEALENVTQHARATHAEVRVKRHGRRVSCVFRDNGVGFDPGAWLSGHRRGLGLMGIQERLNACGGTMQLNAAPGRGTELTVSIPLQPHPRSRRVNACAC